MDLLQSLHREESNFVLPVLLQRNGHSPLVPPYCHPKPDPDGIFQETQSFVTWRLGYRGICQWSEIKCLVMLLLEVLPVQLCLGCWHWSGAPADTRSTSAPMEDSGCRSGFSEHPQGQYHFSVEGSPKRSQWGAVAWITQCECGRLPNTRTVELKVIFLTAWCWNRLCDCLDQKQSFPYTPCFPMQENRSVSSLLLPLASDGKSNNIWVWPHPLPSYCKRLILSWLRLGQKQTSWPSGEAGAVFCAKELQSIINCYPVTCLQSQSR